MTRLIAALALCLMGSTAAAQDCVGRNLIDALPPEARAEIDARTEAVPYHEGLYWRASKGEAQITMIGTYHFSHPMHDRTMERFGPVLAEAGGLLVEMGPEEEAEMQQRLMQDPTLVMDPEGPTLPERMSVAQWQQLSSALEERGVPAVMASRMRPWYAATMLGLSPCMFQQIAAEGETGGLDGMIVDAAEAEGVPITALEPWDTVLTMFAGLSPDEQMEMLVYSLPAASYGDDYATTMIDAYSDQNVWRIWEFGRVDAYGNFGLSRAEVDEMTAEARELLMDDRNRGWIDPLTEAAETAAEQGRGVVAAFGALHLPGEMGVLRLLERDGWTIERLAL